MSKQRTKTPEEIKLRDGWSTPEWLWRPCLDVLGGEAFDFDPCSNSHTTLPAITRWGLDFRIDALTREWPRFATQLTNPPYSRELLPAFVSRWASSDPLGFLLLPFAPATPWWRRHLAGRRGIVFPRLPFAPPPGVAASTPGPICHALIMDRSLHILADTLRCVIESSRIDADKKRGDAWRGTSWIIQ